MQLSLPAASFPTPAAAVPACSGKNSPSQTDSPDAPADSFDSLLSKDQPKSGDEAGDDPTNSNAEQAAGLLAALLWMPAPAVTNAPPTLPAATLDASAQPSGDEVSEPGETGKAMRNAMGTPFSSPTTSRAFARLTAPDRVGVVPPPFAGLVAANSSSPAPAPTPCATVEPAPTVVAIDPSAIAGAESPVPSIDAVPVATGAATITATPMVAETMISEMGSTIVPDTTVPAKNSEETKSGITDSNDLSDATVVDVGQVTAAPTGEDSASLLPVSGGNDVAATSVKSPALRPQEKIAPSPSSVNDNAKSAVEFTEKYFLQPVQKAVMAAGASVGIAVAKLNAAMSAAASSSRNKSASLVEPATFVFSSDAAPTATFTIDAPAPVATVRETLAAVISAVDALERHADVQQKSVDLQFHIGNEKLGLRVELKDGVVHTTFRTESPEMNHALTREWHSLVPTGFGREVKLADPVFNTVATSGSDSSSTSLGQGAQQQREQQKAPPTFASALKREFYDSSPVQESAVPVASTTTTSSQLLNALA